METISPTLEDTTKVLGNAENTKHASKCGMCACKCACRYNDSGNKDKPW